MRMAKKLIDFPQIYGANITEPRIKDPMRQIRQREKEPIIVSKDLHDILMELGVAEPPFMSSFILQESLQPVILLADQINNPLPGDIDVSGNLITFGGSGTESDPFIGALFEFRTLTAAEIATGEVNISLNAIHHSPSTKISFDRAALYQTAGAWGTPVNWNIYSMIGGVARIMGLSSGVVLASPHFGVLEPYNWFLLPDIDTEGGINASVVTTNGLIFRCAAGFGAGSAGTFYINIRWVVGP